MSYGRRAIKAIGLSLIAALGMLALGAAGAQASEYLIEEGGVKKTFVEHGIMSETFSGSFGEGELLSAGLKLYCGSASPSGTFLAGGKVHFTILYSACKVLEHEGCIVYETAKDHEKKLFDGYMVLSGLGEEILHESAHYLKIEGSPLGTVWFNDRENPNDCELPLSVTVEGSFAYKLPNILTPALSQTFQTITPKEETSLKKLFTGFGLTFNGEAAHFKEGSSGSLFLTGALKDKKWGAH